MKKPRYIVLYLITLFIVTALFSSFNAYQKVKVYHSDQIPGGRAEFSDYEVVNTIYGKINIPFETLFGVAHCSSDAQQYYDSIAVPIAFAALLLSLILTIFVVIFFITRKLNFTIRNLVISAIVISTLASGIVLALQNSILEYVSINFFPPCF